MKMNELGTGEVAIVTHINLTGEIRRRLFDLGLIKGTKIECVMKSRCGNPIAYRIRGALIALRNIDTDKIKVRKEVERWD